MRKMRTRFAAGRSVRAAAALALLMAVMASAGPRTGAQSAPEGPAELPRLAGVWDGSPRSRPVNGPDMPWTPDNFPVLNERARACQQVFDEALAQKYDCVPATPPALQYDPYMMEVVQWPERYWCEGEALKVTVTVEDPLFLREPASYTTRWLPAPDGYRLQPYECDPEEARHPDEVRVQEPALVLVPRGGGRRDPCGGPPVPGARYARHVLRGAQQAGRQPDSAVAGRPAGRGLASTPPGRPAAASAAAS